VNGLGSSVGTAVSALTVRPPTDASRAAVASDGVTLSDLIYFGTCWWQFQTVANTTPQPALGNGYRRPTVVYDADGNYFAGTVEKVDANGRVTDVILAFAAAKTASGANALQDITDNALLTYGSGSTQATRAAELYAGLMNDPVYADARIHVTGLSLGSAFTQYVLAYSLVTYGRATTTARADFVHFGVPGYAQGIATHFGLRIADFDGMITGYTPKNDPTPSNLPPGGLQHGQPDLNAKLMGTMHWMADFQPYGTLPAVAAANGLAAHQSFAYIGAFGLPGWMTPQERQYTIDTILANGPAQTKYDPSDGAGGSVGETIIGDGAANVLTGTASDDALQGRAGADVLTGGGGRNSFIYSKVEDSVATNPDLITDFKTGDTIDLSGMGRLSGFVFVGAQRPMRAGTVGFRIVGAETLVEINTTGGSTPDMAIRLAGVRMLTASDFALGGTLTDAARYLLFQALNTTGDPFVDHAYLGATLP
jgi:Ca2+-binding RTX toxin-like protein